MAEAGQTAEGLSKSAKRRAAKKARDAAEAEEVVPAATPAPAPAKEATKENGSGAKPKAKAAAAAPAPAAAEPKPKAKAQAKAKPEAKAAEPKAEPKAAAAKPKAEAKPTAKASAKSSAKAKAAPKPAEEEEPPKKEPELLPFVQMDDGTGGDWEAVTGVSKKLQKKKERVEQEKAEAKAHAAAASFTNIPANQPRIPGMVAPAPAAAGGKAAPVTAPAAVSAAAAGAKGEEAKKAEVQSSTATINVPPEKIGIVIGPKGKNITTITQRTGVTRIETSGEMFTITGPNAAVIEAKAAVQELIDKGYTSLSFDEFSENQVAVHPSAFPDIIGKGGAIIQAMKKELGVEITIPKTPPNPPASKKFKVTIAGAPDKVEKAKKVIDDIVMYAHHEITHPGMVHMQLEMGANDANLRYIIGTKGSELKHIQNNYKVKVNIPREHSMNQFVCIVGEPQDVERANEHIEKVIWNASQPRGRDRADNDGDVWGDEGEDEAWMKQYIYKR
eukprot:CAMPEP_0179301600 /NCGR_PEP_ID=MMETSP0797-20121207/47636_1 /TAXON_ID=47934 /ORGANISM="Dinophysis acuminata, Strain DAEP01" /LENGTH=500 /DNA_ID=CAMNT_0021011111 /DNA_START=40 /DNA_END=1542 /DNA_ORIENTATION=-